jgi:hypothetical protein
MNVTEHLDSILQMARDAAIMHCDCTNGQRPDFTSEIERMEIGDGRIVWAVPSVKCNRCSGSGMVGLDRPVTDVLPGIMSAALMTAVVSRDSARFGDMNEALDWGAARYAEALAEIEREGGSIIGAMGDLVARAVDGRALLDSVTTEQGGGALTEDEIAALLEENAAAPGALILPPLPPPTKSGGAIARWRSLAERIFPDQPLDLPPVAVPAPPAPSGSGALTEDELAELLKEGKSP